MWILWRLKTLGCPIPDWLYVLKQPIMSICEGNIAFWGPIMTKDESFSFWNPCWTKPRDISDQASPLWRSCSPQISRTGPRLASILSNYVICFPVCWLLWQEPYNIILLLHSSKVVKKLTCTTASPRNIRAYLSSVEGGQVQALSELLKKIVFLHFCVSNILVSISFM